MKFALLRLVIVILAAAGPQLRAQGDDSVPQKLTNSDAKRLVADYVGLDEKKAAAARERLLLTRVEDRGLIFDALEARSFVPPKAMKKAKAGITDLELEIPDFEGKTGKVRISVPRSYSAKKPIPVLFRLHGSGGTGADFMDACARMSMIEVAPTIPTDDRIAWNMDPAPQFVMAILDHLLANYNVDTDRLYFSGFSAGGGAAALFAQYWPQRTAGIYSTGRIAPLDEKDWEGSFQILKDIPCYYVVGLADQTDRIDGYRQVEKIAKEHDHKARFEFVKGMDHEYRPEIEKRAFDWLIDHKRVAYPRSFMAQSIWYSNWHAERVKVQERVQWFRIQDPSRSQARGSVKVKVEGQTILISGSVEKAAVALNDRLVDLDQPITIKVNDKTVFEGQVERSVEFLLSWYEKNRDPHWLFWNEIEF